MVYYNYRISLIKLLKKRYIKFASILILNLINQHLYANTYSKNPKNVNIVQAKPALQSNSKEKTWNLHSELNILEQTLISEINNQENNNNKDLNDLEIFAEKNLITDKEFIAEGNVFVKKNELLLSSDKIIYNRDERTFKIIGNIFFRAKEQYLIASEIKYNLSEKKGYIKDAYGNINFATLGLIDPNKVSVSKLKESDLKEIAIKNVSLNDTNTIRFENFTFRSSEESLVKRVTNSFQKVNLDLNEMEKWRFKSKLININNNVYSSDKIYLTNDPYNYPQLIIESTGFETIAEEDITTIKTKSSSVLLDNKFRIPAGARRLKIGEELNGPRWGVGYDWTRKDGLFIYRSFPTFYSKDKRVKLDLKNEFYIQRTILGKTQSFSKKDQSVLANKVKQDITPLDSFGLEGSFDFPIPLFMVNSKFSLNSLDTEKFNKALQLKTEISRILYEKKEKDFSKETKLSFFGNYREIIWNGTIGEREILNAYGLNLSKRNNWINDKIKKSSEIALGYGEYISGSKEDPTRSISRSRLNILLSRNHSYPIWESKQDSSIKADNIYSPSVIQNGIFFNVEGRIDLYGYSDYNYQNLINFRAGPELTLGQYKNKILDYTKFNIYPKFTYAEGSSPFGFDQAVDNHALEISLEQQIIGALSAKISTEYNMDINSPKYKKFFNSRYQLSWNRRAYQILAFYNIESKAGGLNFKIYGFNFEGLGEKF